MLFVVYIIYTENNIKLNINMIFFKIEEVYIKNWTKLMTIKNNKAKNRPNPNL